MRLRKNGAKTADSNYVTEKIILAIEDKNTYNTAYTRDKCLSQPNRRIKV